VRADAAPSPSYLDTLARYYDVGVHQADFGNKPNEARRAINVKVATDTHELISELIPPNAIDEDVVTVLTNALYFKAPWAKSFAPPQPGDFRSLDGSTSHPNMLRTLTALPYYAGDGFVSVALPYYGSELSMLLVVPDAGAYEPVRGHLSGDALTALVAEQSSEAVDLSVPVFKVASVLPAMKTLKGLGMNRAFDQAAAEFPKLNSERFQQVSVSAVLHQATVAIDELGTEASAATAIIASGGGSSVGAQPPEPKVVTVDRPFLFVLRDNPTGSVLFVGQVVAL
jgi:serpin B